KKFRGSLPAFIAAFLQEEKLTKKEAEELQESRDFLKKKFRGSLPAFIAAFLQEEKLTKKEAEELQELINQASEGGGNDSVF
ncbi:MAG: BlaI/MecI/CopY family transcriptional regulator, partial [Lachnospiraceae bacterium]|nr:BlaI/MecI/CopY family transcriptional regulator [Lachnospiraceae bacterium]